MIISIVELWFVICVSYEVFCCRCFDWVNIKRVIVEVFFSVFGIKVSVVSVKVGVRFESYGVSGVCFGS